MPIHGDHFAVCLERAEGRGRKSRRRPKITMIGYTRVSSDRQGQDGDSLEQQEIAIRAYAHEMSLDLHSIGQDIAQAGDRPVKRPDLLDVICSIKELRRLDPPAKVGVLETKINRLGRRGDWSDFNPRGIMRG
ncbi:recombinase family protein [Flavimaricola marinus]|uniref:Resolvase/invertase-type recombinase catalytic domain-containing protein n=1 Tax=Flavimaricola marinus TaxID=1819565 RepID=A0A238LKU9_9RHOB|nr:recombinase family protein [Flavimaricola marinus]SMY10262.1 hypothetical protein LOM8899_04437 [Flavimaricola marinus]